jgi:hypothetical protein
VSGFLHGVKLADDSVGVIELADLDAAGKEVGELVRVEGVGVKVRLEANDGVASDEARTRDGWNVEALHTQEQLFDRKTKDEHGLEHGLTHLAGGAQSARHLRGEHEIEQFDNILISTGNEQIIEQHGERKGLDFLGDARPGLGIERGVGGERQLADECHGNSNVNFAQILHHNEPDAARRVRLPEVSQHGFRRIRGGALQNFARFCDGVKRADARDLRELLGGGRLVELVARLELDFGRVAHWWNVCVWQSSHWFVACAKLSNTSDAARQ